MAMHRIEADELATILAALRYWQQEGMGEPDNRSDDLHAIATANDEVISLDETAIGELCERLNCDGQPGPAGRTRGMIHKLTDTEHFYIRSMGKALRLVAIADNDDDANRFMMRNDGAAVVACLGPLVLMADKNDNGIDIPRA